MTLIVVGRSTIINSQRRRDLSKEMLNVSHKSKEPTRLRLGRGRGGRCHHRREPF